MPGGDTRGIGGGTTVKSVNRGNAGQDAPVRGNGAMPGMAGDDPYGDGGSPLPGVQDPARVPLRELMDDRLLDELLERSKDAAGGLRLTGEGSMLGELVRAVLERALEAELTAHLGYGRHDPAGHHSGNSRNGTIDKTVQTGVGPVPLAVPRDRAGTFEPLLVPKRAGRVAGGLDDMVISLYARHERAGHPAPPGAGLRHPAVPRDRLADHRRGAGGGAGLAGPAAGPGLGGGVPGRDRGQGPRQPGRAEQA